ncbi:MAG: 50S ribosomal protein L17 [Pseudomonadota bacterium]
MRHRKAGRKLGVNSAHRAAMLRNLVTSLLAEDRIETTDARAKEIRGLADHMIGLAKRGDLHARRQAAAVVRNPDVVKKLFDIIGPRCQNSQSGYTRIVRTRQRAGDAAQMALIELISAEAKEPKKKPKKEKAAAG